MKAYNVFNKLEYLYYYVKTATWYKLFLHKSGNGNVIYKPVLITPHFIDLADKVQIRNNARIEGVQIKSQPQIIIRNGVNIEQNVHITCGNRVAIGAHTAIAANVTITDIKHGYEDILVSPQQQPLEISEVSIGSECTIYNNSVILPGAFIGNRCIVAANSVVPGKTYPDFCIIAGAPARVTKRYNLTNKKWERTNAVGEFEQSTAAKV